MDLKVSELAELSGVTVRTLQYYDRIGLLRAKKDPDNGYRIYTAADVDRLQEILLFREMDLPLKDIAGILDGSDYDRLEALRLHRSLIAGRLENLRLLYQNISQSINEMEEGIEMSKKDKFKGMDFKHNPYEAEARQKWGDDKVDESNAKLQGKSEKALSKLEEDMNAIFSDFARMRHEDPTSPPAVELAARFHRLLNEEVGSFYNKEVFKGLGEMYVEDVRFTENLDRLGEGTAAFMRDAMGNYSDQYL